MDSLGSRFQRALFFPGIREFKGGDWGRALSLLENNSCPLQIWSTLGVLLTIPTDIYLCVLLNSTASNNHFSSEIHPCCMTHYCMSE